MSFSIRSLVLSTLGFLVAVAGVHADTFLANGYAVNVWQSEDGLPQNAVTSAVQTADGYLWIGTFGGLARFDGVRFRVFTSANTPELPDDRIASLFEDKEGTLWIGHESGAVTRYRDGRFESVEMRSEVANERVLALGSDEQGRMWMMRGSGALDSPSSDGQIPTLVSGYAPSVMSWARNTEGSIWVAENGRAARLANGKFAPIEFPQPLITDFVLSMAASADGGVWVLLDDRIRKWKDGRWTEDRGGYPWVEGSVLCTLELHDGALAVGTLLSGLHLIFPDGRPPIRFDRSDGLPQDWVRFLYEDREGNLWLGSGSGGLVSIHSSAFSVLTPPDEWQGHAVLSVAPGRDGSLWVGTEGAGLYHRDNDGAWTLNGPAEGLGNAFIWAARETREGDIWVGSWTNGPYRLTNGHFTIPEPLDTESGPILALDEDPDTGALLIGNREGLLQWKDDQAVWLYRHPDGVPANVLAIERDRRGAIWFGFARDGLARLADGALSTFTRDDGLGSNAVQCLFFDEDGSLWIGTSNGLSRYKDGRFANLTASQGLAHNVVCHLEKDDSGYLWLSTHGGIQRVAREELNRCADGMSPEFSSQVYGRSDGLPTNEFTVGLQAAGCKTADGRLWFTSSKGLVGVDPARVELNDKIPLVALESILVDGTRTLFNGGAIQGALAPDHQRLEFQFTGLSFVAPSKVQFKYRLDGLDKNWVEAGSERTAFYSHLPAGDYRFRVIACNNDGLWSTQAASVAFTVAPFFWQTWWFASAVSALALSIAAFSARFVTRRRAQRRMEELEQQHALERERSRIARDIHDDVGASLTRIAMLSRTPQSQEVVQPSNGAALSRIYGTACEVRQTLDEIVWAVDPRHDTLDSLVGYLGKYAQDFLGTANIRCRLDPPIELPAWRITAETRHNLFLAFKETLNNILKHAAATEVRVSLKLLPDAFELMVADDGQGFDPSRERSPAAGRIASGNGLSNMRKRLASIGGRCDISSEPGHGARVSFIVSAPGKAQQA